jgi:hypothetical protein
MVRARRHLIRRDRLLDLEVAGKAPQAFLRAVLGGRWGNDAMEHLGRWRERGERSLDRAHRRFLRQRQANRKELVESVTEPRDLPLVANANRDQPAAPAAAPKTAGDPEPAPSPPLPPPADANDPHALYGEILRHTDQAALTRRLRALGPVQQQQIMRVLERTAPLAEQPVQARWAWQAMLRR